MAFNNHQSYGIPRHQEPTACALQCTKFGQMGIPPNMISIVSAEPTRTASHRCNHPRLATSAKYYCRSGGIPAVSSTTYCIPATRQWRPRSIATSKDGRETSAGASEAWPNTVQRRQRASTHCKDDTTEAARAGLWSSVLPTVLTWPRADRLPPVHHAKFTWSWTLF